MPDLKALREKIIRTLAYDGGFCRKEKMDEPPRTKILINFSSAASNPKMLRENTKRYATPMMDYVRANTKNLLGVSQLANSPNITEYVEYLEKHPDVLSSNLGTTPDQLRSNFDQFVKEVKK